MSLSITHSDIYASAANQWEANTGVSTRYIPRGGARDIYLATDSTVLVAGPAGTGKSRACLEKVRHAMLSHPGAKALLLRKTAVSLTSTGLVTWREKVVPDLIKKGTVTYYGGSQQEPPKYRFANGSEVMLGGLDNPTKVMSSEYDLIFIQEATEVTQTDWEACETRIRNGVIPHMQLIADCNPDRPDHWLKQRCDSGNVRLITSTHKDNPTLYTDDGELTPFGAEYLGRRLGTLTGPRRERLLHGRWVGTEGAIYTEYDSSIHLINPFPIPLSWPRYWAVDFGFTHPFVLQQWAVDPDGRLHMYREIYRTGLIVADHAKAILDICAPGGVWNEPKPQAIICDHQAEDRASLERALKLPTKKAKKNVSDGIQSVKQRMQKAGDGKPRIYFHRNAVARIDQELVDNGRPASTVEEIPGYIWNKTKDAPIKEMDDGCDAMRYMVAEMDLRKTLTLR